MSFEPREYLRHILAEAEYLVTHSRDLTPEKFHADETLRRAFVRIISARRATARERKRHET